MKKVLFSLSILSILLISSCGSDDGGDTSVENQVTLGDEIFDINNGGFVDFGESEGTSQGGFILTDGAVSISGNTFSVSQATISISFTLVSLGTGGLQSGSYPFGDVVSAGSTNAFLGAAISANGASPQVTGGTITLSGSSPNFTITLDLDLNTDEKLTGGFAGEFSTE